MSRSKPRPRRSPRLHIESLEARIVPTTGTLLVEAFVDQNQNGVLDSGESGVAGAVLGYRSPGGSGSVVTGENGSGSVVVDEGTGSYTVLAPVEYTFGGAPEVGTFTITAGQQTT